MTKTFITCLSFCACLLIFSCSRPADTVDNPPPVTFSDSTLLRQFITFDYHMVPDTIFAESYFYDANKRLTSVITKSQVPGGSGGPKSIAYDTLTYFYEGNDPLVRMAIFKNARYTVASGIINKTTYTYKYGYDNIGRVTTDTMTTGNLTNFNRYVYVSNTEITQVSKTIVAGAGSSGDIPQTILLGWQNNNLIAEQRGVSSIAYQISYDNKIFPFHKARPVYSFIPSVQPFSSNGLWPFRCSKNNPVQIYTTTYATGVPLTNTLNYTYQYRSDGYPIRATQSPIPFNGWLDAVFLYY